jgi:lipoprotein-anchoring transpeptidase ErfK/SrfK
MPEIGILSNNAHMNSAAVPISTVNLPPNEQRMIRNGLVLLFCCSLLIFGCDSGPVASLKKKVNLRGLFAKLKGKKTNSQSDTTNVFDSETYDPATVDSAEILKAIETLYESDSAMIAKVNTSARPTLSKPTDSLRNDSTTAYTDTFTNDIKKIQTSEVVALKENLEQIKGKLSNAPLDTAANSKKQIACKIWADVSKKDQRLYLYVEGKCVDTFKVSTGTKGHETPNIDRRPSGPVFRKYTSKKYPGGNYNGLGNMPYVVFVQGGYGIHGTTLGNIPKLGTKASHGCVRVHPDNAKIFNELVSAAGLQNTWITIRD